jgi:hypothetical protein
MRDCGCAGLARGLGGRRGSAHLRASVLALPVHGQEPFPRAHRASRLAAQAPNPDAARIGRPLWPGSTRQPHREPRLARRAVRRGARGRETGHVVTLAARQPGVAGGPCDVPKPAETRRAPAWTIELHDREAGWSTCGRTVGGEPRALLGRGPRERRPAPLDRVVTAAACPGRSDEPHECPRRPPGVQTCESLACLPHGVGPPGTGPCRDDLDGVGDQAAHALRLTTSCEGADRCRMCVGVRGPLGGGTLVAEQQRAPECLAPRHRSAAALLPLGTIRQCQHGGVRPGSSPRTSGAGHTRRRESLVRWWAKGWGKERASWSAGDGGKPGARHPLAPTPWGLEDLDRPMRLSGVPPQPHRAMPVPRVARVGGGGGCLVGLGTRPLPMTIGAEPLQDGVAALLGPLQVLAKAGEKAPGVALAHLGVGSPALPTEGRRRDEPGSLFLGIEPQTQRGTQSGMACALDPSRGVTPVERAIEAPEECSGEADTNNPRVVLCSAGHHCPSCHAAHDTMSYTVAW